MLIPITRIKGPFINPCKVLTELRLLINITISATEVLFWKITFWNKFDRITIPTVMSIDFMISQKFANLVLHRIDLSKMMNDLTFFTLAFHFFILFLNFTSQKSSWNCWVGIGTFNHIWILSVLLASTASRLRRYNHPSSWVLLHSHIPRANAVPIWLPSRRSYFSMSTII